MKYQRLSLFCLNLALLCLSACEQSNAPKYTTIIYSESAPKNIKIAFEDELDAIDLFVKDEKNSKLVTDQLQKITTNSFFEEITKSIVIEPHNKNNSIKFKNNLKINLKLSKTFIKEKLALFYIKKNPNGDLIGLCPLKDMINKNNEVEIETKNLGLFKVIQLSNPIFTKIEQLEKKEQ